MMQAWLKKANPALEIKDADTKTARATKRSASAAGDGDDSAAAASGEPPAKRSTAAGNDPLASKPIPEDGPTELALERSSMHPSWYWRLEKEFGKPYFKQLKTFLDKELKGNVPIYPEPENIYTWAKLPFKSVKVVILGQDPYHNPHQAHGLSFSVLPGERPPPSLVNIYKELQSDLSLATPPATHGYLMSWANQGVLLLNAVLTVRKNQPASHAKQGWEQLTDAVIKAISDERDGVVFILWGSHAQKKGAGIDKKKHLVLKSVHPSPLSAHRGFFGSRPFSKANEYLQKKGKEPVDWAKLPVDVQEQQSEMPGGIKAQPEAAASAVAGTASAPMDNNAAVEAKEQAAAENVQEDANIDAATKAAELAALNELANNGLLKDW